MNHSLQVPAFCKWRGINDDQCCHHLFYYTLNWGVRSGKNAKKEKVYGDANTILSTASAEQATRRPGTKELTQKQEGSRTVRCVQSQNFIHTGLKAEGGMGGGGEGKYILPIQVDPPLEVKLKMQ